MHNCATSDCEILAANFSPSLSPIASETAQTIQITPITTKTASNRRHAYPRHAHRQAKA